jgi:hypothetical protein
MEMSQLETNYREVQTVGFPFYFEDDQNKAPVEEERKDSIEGNGTSNYEDQRSNIEESRATISYTSTGGCPRKHNIIKPHNVTELQPVQRCKMHRRHARNSCTVPDCYLAQLDNMITNQAWRNKSETSPIGKTDAKGRPWSQPAIRQHYRRSIVICIPSTWFKSLLKSAAISSSLSGFGS